MNRSFSCKEFSDFIICHLGLATWGSSRDRLPHTDPHADVAISLAPPWPFLEEPESAKKKKKKGCDPLDSHALYVGSPVLCHALLFGLESFDLQGNFRTMPMLYSQSPDQ